MHYIHKELTLFTLFGFGRNWPKTIKKEQEGCLHLNFGARGRYAAPSSKLSYQEYEDPVSKSTTFVVWAISTSYGHVVSYPFKKWALVSIISPSLLYGYCPCPLTSPVQWPNLRSFPIANYLNSFNAFTALKNVLQNILKKVQSVCFHSSHILPFSWKCWQFSVCTGRADGDATSSRKLSASAHCHL